VPADRFCEGCGTVLASVRRVAVPFAPKDSGSAVCNCGNGTFVDQYCSVCGLRRAEPDRDRAELDGIVLVTDRGLEHERNEDAAAAGVVACGPGDSECVAVAVCDGVSTSSAADTAAKGASAAGVDAMLSSLAASASPQSAVLAGLTAAAGAAVKAGAHTLDPLMAPSCTYAGAVVVAGKAGATQIAVGNVGDSRVYWLPEPPAPPQCLTVDDSVSQELISAGVAVDSDLVQAGAHTLTRWLGADAEAKPWSDSSVRTISVTGRGVLLMCTDGLWNYLPGADDIARICAGHDAAAASAALVDYALSAGGQDNITVVLIPIGGHP
jgi:serine/threonine protein phosphatase PrpC